jgi:hypothetical protein
MSLYTAGGWNDFLVAAAGAAGALTGLVFLGITINVQRIIAYAGLPGRAVATLVVLMNALIIALVALMPVTSHVTLGLAVLIVSLFGWGTTIFIEFRNRAPAAEVQQHRRNWVVLSQLGTVPYVIGGISLLAAAGGGMFWLVAGTCLALIIGLANGWVLLVEILR